MLPKHNSTSEVELVPGVELRRTLKGHSAGINRLVWSPDGKTLASVSEDKSVRLWRFKAGGLRHVLKGHGEDVTSVAWSPDGKYLASAAYDGKIRFWDSVSGELLSSSRAHGDVITKVVWSPDGRTLASASRDQTLLLWDVESRAIRFKFQSHLISDFAWSSDGRHLVSVGWDGTIQTWGEGTVEPLMQSRASENHLTCIAWSKSLNIFATCGVDNDISIWDGKTSNKLNALQGHTGSVLAVSFSADSRLLASLSADQSLRLWDCEKWETIARVESKVKSPTWIGLGIQFHPTEAVLAIPNEDRKSIKLFQIDLNELITSGPSFASVHYSNAKVILIGETSTGKTCLARALMGLPFEPQKSTHGMKVWNYHTETVPRPGGGQVSRETLLWDLAGQTDYQVVHQLFLDDTALGIVLFDATHPEHPFSGVALWEKALRRVAGEDCPRLLVAGRVDRGHPTATATDIKAFCLEHGFKDFIATSANTEQGIETLRAAIKKALNWENLPITSSPKVWQSIREYILKRRAGLDLLTRRSELRETFRREHINAVFNDNEFDTVIGHMQVQGLVWQLSFGDFILLKPELLNDYASAVVRVARRHPAGLGSLAERAVLEARMDFEDLDRLADPEMERTLLHAVVELFLSREVALREDRHIVFPSKFNRKRPEFPEPPRREAAYRFSGPIEDIYTTLVVRLFYSGKFKLKIKNLWKNAVEFRDAKGKTCGFMLETPEEGQGILSVFFDKEIMTNSKVLFLRFIYEHLQKRALFGSSTRERIYRCPKCNEEIKDKQAVQRRLRNNMSTIFCQYCDEQILLIDRQEEMFGDPGLLRQVQKLEEKVEEEKEREVLLTTAKAKEEIGEFDVFLAHNSADKPYIELIVGELRRRGINPWFDEEQIPPGRWFQDVIQEVIPMVKSAAIILGPKGLGKWEAVELRSFISQCVEREIPVIPVLLPGVATVPKNLSFLRELNWVRFTRDSEDEFKVDDKALDDLQWGITGKRPQK